MQETQNDADFNNWRNTVKLFFTSQSITLFGSALVQYSIIWYITLETGSGVMLTIATLMGFVPQVLITLFAGVWADRYDKKKIVMFSDGAIAVATLIIAILFKAGYQSYTLLFLVLLVRSFGTGLQTPAVNAIIPSIVPQDKLLRINGIKSTISSCILLLAPAMAAAMLNFSSLSNIFFIDVITAIIGISIMLIIKIPHDKEKSAKKGKLDYFKELKEGYVYVKNKPFLRDLILFYSIFFFISAPAIFLTPLLATRIFGNSELILGSIEIAFFTGTLLGGICISLWSGFKNKTYTIGFSCIIFGVISIFFGLSTHLLFFLGTMFICGIIVPFFNAPTTALIQEVTDESVMGRVFSLMQLASTIALPLGMIIFGPLSDIIKIQYLLISSGFIVILVGVLVFFNKNFKNASF